MTKKHKLTNQLSPPGARCNDGTTACDSPSSASSFAATAAEAEAEAEAAATRRAAAEAEARSKAKDEKISSLEVQISAKDEEISRLEEQAASFLVALRSAERELEERSLQSLRLEADINELTTEVVRYRRLAESPTHASWGDGGRGGGDGGGKRGSEGDLLSLLLLPSSSSSAAGGARREALLAEARLELERVVATEAKLTQQLAQKHSVATAPEAATWNGGRTGSAPKLWASPPVGIPVPLPPPPPQQQHQQQHEPAAFAASALPPPQELAQTEDAMEGDDDDEVDADQQRALLAQVMQLTDEQIAALPDEQREQIELLRQQITAA